MSFETRSFQKKSQTVVHGMMNTGSCRDYPEPSGTVPTVRMLASQE